LNNVLNEKQIKIAAITESKKKFKGTVETHKYVVIYRGVNRGTRAQVRVMFWIHK
jgi:predicted RNA-binding protein with TRAM domain